MAGDAPAQGHAGEMEFREPQPVGELDDVGRRALNRVVVGPAAPAMAPQIQRDTPHGFADRQGQKVERVGGQRSAVQQDKGLGPAGPVEVVQP